MLCSIIPAPASLGSCCHLPDVPSLWQHVGNHSSPSGGNQSTKCIKVSLWAFGEMRKCGWSPMLVTVTAFSKKLLEGWVMEGETKEATGQQGLPGVPCFRSQQRPSHSPATIHLSSVCFPASSMCAAAKRLSWPKMHASVALQMFPLTYVY